MITRSPKWGTVFVEKTYTDDSLLTIILYVTLALSACFCALASGVSRLPPPARQPPRARLIAEAVAIGLVVAFSADLLLFGVNPGLWFLGACALILIAAHVWVDPSLSGERELQRRLRLMQTREGGRGRHPRSGQDRPRLYRTGLLQPVLDLRHRLGGRSGHRVHLHTCSWSTSATTRTAPTL